MKYYPVQTHVMYDKVSNTYEYLTDSGLALYGGTPIHTAESKKDAKVWVMNDIATEPAVFIDFNTRSIKIYNKGDGPYPKGNVLQCNTLEEAEDLLASANIKAS